MRASEAGSNAPALAQLSRSVWQGRDTLHLRLRLTGGGVSGLPLTQAAWGAGLRRTAAVRRESLRGIKLMAR
ncbi:hypothetical protein BJF93_18645 [Xaviernesmea oryzae]|uniref:Uncharacterized protein n=1 Tax=Xaviernesmea oryzae TaxID=464029 RepID=A0A1Q9B2J0_9HYPH|nr:hypothetical protein BJF93_18645 [Xaviernesmea oryzae]